MLALEIISTTPFRRLTGKQQVFRPTTDDHCRTRYTHTMDVYFVCRKLAPDLLRMGAATAAECEIAEVACLAHDLGMPCFGHAGENAIRDWVAKAGESLIADGLARDADELADYLAFDSNSQTLRLIGYHRQLRRAFDAADPACVTASVKYPQLVGGGAYAKAGILRSELEAYRLVAARRGLPEIRPGVFARDDLSYLMEVCDDIAYLTADLEDAARLNLLKYEELRYFLLKEELFDIGVDTRPLRSYELWKMRIALMEGLCARYLELAEAALIEGRSDGGDPAGEGLFARAARAFFDSAIVRSIKEFSIHNIYRRRDQKDRVARKVAPRLMKELTAEISGRGARLEKVAEVVRAARSKRGPAWDDASPLKLAVDLICEFTDEYAALVAGEESYHAVQREALYG